MDMSLTLDEIQELAHYLRERTNLSSSLTAVMLKLQAMLPTPLPDYSETTSQVR